MLKKISVAIFTIIITVIISVSYNWLTGNPGLLYSPIFRYIYSFNKKEIDLNAIQKTEVELSSLPEKVKNYYLSSLLLEKSNDNLSIDVFYSKYKTETYLNLTNNKIKFLKSAPSWGNGSKWLFYVYGKDYYALEVGNKRINGYVPFYSVLFDNYLFEPKLLSNKNINKDSIIFVMYSIQ